MMTKPIYELEKIEDLRQLVERGAREFGDSFAYSVKKNGEYKGITYKECKDYINSYGTALVDLGLSGEKIAVISESRYEWCMTFLSVVNGVGVIVPLDKELPANEIENLLVRSDARAIVFSSKYKQTILDIKKNLDGLKILIDMDAASDNDGVLSLDKLIKAGKKLLDSGNDKYINAEIDRDKMSMLFFTSGTTDLAKGVMLSHRNIASDIHLARSVMPIEHGFRALSILPLHHTYECTAGFMIMYYCGVTVAFAEGLKYISQNLKEVKPTIILVVPLLIENMYNKIWAQIKKSGMTTKVKIGMFVSDFLYNVFKVDIKQKLFGKVLEAFGGELKIMISGGAAVKPEILKGLRSFGISTVQGYGLTECSPIAALNHLTNYRDAAIGLPLPETYMDIYEPDEKGIGEIRVKGPMVMLGYYENKEATDAVLKDGYFYTGDIGYKDKDGFFYITGRKKNVIVTKNGKNIFPEEVESYLNNSDCILESLVYGKDIAEEKETRVCAIIVPNYDAITSMLGKEPSEEEIKKIIDEEVRKANKKMPMYKMVREFEIRKEEFEKTTTKKIKRKANV